MTVAEEIQRLTQLRDQGALTQAEFEAAKAKAISGKPMGFDMANPSANQMAMFLHFSQYLGYMVPLLGFAAPILIWQLKKDDMPELDVHGRIVANWLLSSLIYGVVCFVLTFFLIGLLGFLVLSVLLLVYPIIGGIKANDGVPWDYPGSLRFF